MGDIVEKALKAIQDKYKGKIEKADKVSHIILDPERCYSFGSKVLNYQLSGNSEIGFPMGKIIEIYGLEGTFKSTLLLEAYREVQSKGYTVAHIDAERAWNPELAEKLGIDLSRLILLENDTAEEHFNMAMDLAANHKDLNLGLIGVDSIDALIPESVNENEIGDSEMGRLALVMGQGLRKLKDRLHKTPVSIVYINQIRKKIGVMFGNPDTRRGGMALHFYAWMNIEVRTSRTDAEEVTDLTEEKVKTGAWITAQAVKNKQYPPYRKAKIYGEYGKGIDKANDLLDASLFFGVLKKVKAGKGFRIDVSDFKKTLSTTEDAVTRKKMIKFINDNKGKIRTVLDKKLRDAPQASTTIRVDAPEPDSD